MTLFPVLFFFIMVASSLATLPQGWKACKVKSNDCLLKTVNVALQSLKNGNKQLGVGPIDPLKIISMKMDQGTGPVRVDLEFQDLDIIGLSACNVTAVKNDNWKSLEGQAICETFDMMGKYKANGKVLSLPLSGNGSCHIHFDDMEANITIQLKEILSKGKKYFHVSSLNLALGPKNATFNFENLFDGDKLLSENMNTFLNENSEIIVKELNPAFSKGLTQAFFQLTTQIFSKIPANEINIH